MTARLQHKRLAYVPADAHDALVLVTRRLPGCLVARSLAAYTPADAHNACVLLQTSQLMLMRLSCLLDDCPAAAYTQLRLMMRVSWWHLSGRMQHSSQLMLMMRMSWCIHPS